MASLISDDDVPARSAGAAPTIDAMLPRQTGDGGQRLSLESGNSGHARRLGRGRRHLLEIERLIAIAFRVGQPLVRPPGGKGILTESVGVKLEAFVAVVRVGREYG